MIKLGVWVPWSG